MPVEVLVAVVGLMGAVISYLAGRHRFLVKAYQGLISDLRSEIDRLHKRISDLETMIESMRPKRRTRVVVTT